MKKAFVLSYLGTAYHGWQRQANTDTVQQRIEEAVLKVCGHSVYVSGCGRTDAGVHARYYVASAPLDTSIPDARLPAALNSALPSDIVISKAVTVDEQFDARFSCISKEYTYLIHNSRSRDPFYIDRAYFYPKPLDIDAMASAARIFAGKKDFASLMSEGSPVKSTVREILYCTVTRTARDVIAVRVRADGFLYNMVRAITGTLVYCGLGKLSPDDVAAILAGRSRCDAGPNAPAHGLYMTALTYGMEELDGQSEH